MLNVSDFSKDDRKSLKREKKQKIQAKHKSCKKKVTLEIKMN